MSYLIYQKLFSSFYLEKKTPDIYKKNKKQSSLPVSVCIKSGGHCVCVCFVQHAFSMTARETNCFSLFMEVCSDSWWSETRLPGLLKVILAVSCVLLPWSCISCFARTSSNRRLCLGAVGLDCLNMSTWNCSKRVTDRETHKNSIIFFQWWTQKWDHICEVFLGQC